MRKYGSCVAIRELMYELGRGVRGVGKSDLKSRRDLFKILDTQKHSEAV